MGDELRAIDGAPQVLLAESIRKHDLRRQRGFERVARQGLAQYHGDRQSDRERQFRGGGEQVLLGVTRDDERGIAGSALESA
jgi:hypothetical protein